MMFADMIRAGVWRPFGGDNVFKYESTEEVEGDKDENISEGSQEKSCGDWKFEDEGEFYEDEQMPEEDNMFENFWQSSNLNVCQVPVNIPLQDDEGLPVLVVELEDPLGSRFDELLYWVRLDVFVGCVDQSGRGR